VSEWLGGAELPTGVKPKQLIKNSAGSILVLIALGFSDSGKGYQQLLKIFTVLLN